MSCLECNGLMHNIGCQDKIVFDDGSWDETWVCDKCKIKQRHRMNSRRFFYRNLDEYREVEVIS